MATGLSGVDFISGTDFINFLDEQTPNYDKDIVRDIWPQDGVIGHVAARQWVAGTGIEHTFDRFRNVYPNTTKAWQARTATACIGNPCDPPMAEICYGYDRHTYGLERQSWGTPLFCFDDIMPRNRATEHLSQIFDDVLRPATSYISSDYYLRKQQALAGKLWAAQTTGMPDYTAAWTLSGDSEYVMTTSLSPNSLLMPQMLQARFNPLCRAGYFGKNNAIYTDIGSKMLILWTDNDTLLSMTVGRASKLATNVGGVDVYATNQFRWTSTSDVTGYNKYDIQGTLGNIAVRAFPFLLRFNRIGVNTFQRVLPYVNSAATSGIGGNVLDDYDSAWYQLSVLHHPEALPWYTHVMQPVSDRMPFMVRGLGGQWHWAMDNLGSDASGDAIANYRKNKGFFYADFEYAVKPEHPEWTDSIFHMREKPCIVGVEPCAPDPGSPSQAYDSECESCDENHLLYFVPTRAAVSGNYQIAADTVTCSGDPSDHGAINSATIAALVIALNADAGLALLGTWSADGVAGVKVDTTCGSITIPWVA